MCPRSPSTPSDVNQVCHASRIVVRPSQVLAGPAPPCNALFNGPYTRISGLYGACNPALHEGGAARVGQGRRFNPSPAGAVAGAADGSIRTAQVPPK